MRYCGELIRNADGAAATPEDRGKEHFVIARVSVLIDEPSFKARALTSDHHALERRCNIIDGQRIEKEGRWASDLRQRCHVGARDRNASNHCFKKHYSKTLVQ